MSISIFIHPFPETLWQLSHHHALKPLPLKRNSPAQSRHSTALMPAHKLTCVRPRGLRSGVTASPPCSVAKRKTEPGRMLPVRESSDKTADSRTNHRHLKRHSTTSLPAHDPIPSNELAVFGALQLLGKSAIWSLLQLPDMI